MTTSDSHAANPFELCSSTQEFVDALYAQRQEWRKRKSDYSTRLKDLRKYFEAYRKFLHGPGDREAKPITRNVYSLVMIKLKDPQGPLNTFRDVHDVVFPSGMSDNTWYTNIQIDDISRFMLTSFDRIVARTGIEGIPDQAEPSTKVSNVAGGSSGASGAYQPSRVAGNDEKIREIDANLTAVTGTSAASPATVSEIPRSMPRTNPVLTYIENISGPDSLDTSDGYSQFHGISERREEAELRRALHMSMQMSEDDQMCWAMEMSEEEQIAWAMRESLTSNEAAGSAHTHGFSDIMRED